MTSSRLIVKNLPKNVNEVRLRKIFSIKGTVTDCALKYTKSGKFRHFAFIGFKDESEAECALTHFDKTYIDSRKIEVGFCQALFGVENKLRPWSKYSRGSSAFDSLHQDDRSKNLRPVKKNKVSSKNIDADTVEKSIEDVTVQISPEIDSEVLKEDVKLATESQPPVSTNKDDAVISDMDFLRTFVNTKLDDSEQDGVPALQNNFVSNRKKEWEPEFVVKMRGVPFKCKRDDVVNFFSPLHITGIKMPKSNARTSPVVVVRFASLQEREEAMKRNKNYMGKRFIELLRAGDEGTSKPAEIVTEESGMDDRAMRSGEEVMEPIIESGRLFLRNLSYLVTESDIQKLFAKYGDIVELFLPIDYKTKKPMGFCFITFMFPEHALKAFQQLDGTSFQGRLLHILPAKPKREDPSELVLRNSSSSFKEKKEAATKLLRQSDHNWNTLFLGINAVADIMAQQYGVAKTDIMEPGKSSSVSVRMALGEAQIMSEMKDWLTSRGVILDSFGQAATVRSKSTFLLKNLPANTQPGDLKYFLKRTLCGGAGREYKLERDAGLLKFLLPPHGVTGVVEFATQPQAQKAYNLLAYRKFSHQPIYVEWAPVGLLGITEEVDPDIDGDKLVSETKIADVDHEGMKGRIQNKNSSEDVPIQGGHVETVEIKNYQETMQLRNEDEATKTAVSNDESLGKLHAEIQSKTQTEGDATQSEGGVTLYVKNLNFDTTEEDLRNHLKKLGELTSVTVATKRDPNRGLLSMGYGFVEFALKNDCTDALKKLQHSMLANHQLELKLSQRASLNRPSSKRKQQDYKEQGSCTKILVRNVPFECTLKEINDLFCTFGNLKSTRIPKKISMSTSTSSHRGFAFVDYHSKEDAKRAFDSLAHSTHLYGRRLVLEWAHTGTESIDAIRKRTADHFHEGLDKRVKITEFIDQLDNLGVEES